MKLHPSRSENDNIVDGSELVHTLNPGSSMGQSEKNSVRVYVFRFALKLRHCSTQPALRICATSSHRITQPLGTPRVLQATTGRPAAGATTTGAATAGRATQPF